MWKLSEYVPSNCLFRSAVSCSGRPFANRQVGRTKGVISECIWRSLKLIVERTSVVLRSVSFQQQQTQQLTRKPCAARLTVTADIDMQLSSVLTAVVIIGQDEDQLSECCIRTGGSVCANSMHK